MGLYLSVINSDRCPDAVAALAVLGPILLAVLLACTLICAVAR